MDIVDLIRLIKQSPECAVLPANGQPRINEHHVLPADVSLFYQLCGGVTLYRDATYPVVIVPPEQFILANPVIVGELCEYDISSNWYIVARDIQGEYLTIDLSAERNGKCHDSFYDRHGVRGSCPVIAKSFNGLLEQLLIGKGGYYFWLQHEFINLGDAYD